MSMTLLDLNWRVVCQSPLFIGSGATTPGADKSTVVDGDGRPIIPGSSFKGRLRQHCERIARSLEVWTCDPPQPNRMCPHHPDNAGRYCPVCMLFGSAWQPSSIRFQDALPKRPSTITSADDWKMTEKTDLRRGVSINRRRRTAEDKKLYTLRTAQPGMPLEYDLRLTGHLPAGQGLAGLLVAGLLDLEQIGGGNSRGLGWLHRGNLSGKVGDDELVPAEELTTWLTDELETLYLQDWPLPGDNAREVAI